ncbi:hypothetical protein Tco_0295310 [Tanacetum coccineum]
MFATTVCIVEPKNIKEAMADSAWIEAMQDELHQFDRLQVWNRWTKPFGKNVNQAKVVMKNKKDEDQHVARLVAVRILSSYTDSFDPDHPDKVYRLRKALYGLNKLPESLYDGTLKIPDFQRFY